MVFDVGCFDGGIADDLSFFEPFIGQGHFIFTMQSGILIKAVEAGGDRNHDDGLFSTLNANGAVGSDDFAIGFDDFDQG